MSTIEDAPPVGTTTPVGLAQSSFVTGAAPDPVSREKHGLIGAQISRVDGLLKVTGSAKFAAEFPLDGMVYAAVAFSTIAKGHIANLETADAEAAPGVVLVMTHRNAPRLNPAPVFGSGPRAASGDDLHILQNGRIHWNGQPIAVVLADTQEQADHAASLVAATYLEDTAATAFEAAKSNAKPASFQGEALALKIGDAEAALAAAPVKVDNVYRTPRHNHNAIELHAVTVAWAGDALRVHDASQCVAHVAWTLGEIFGLGEDKVHVTSPYVGGGFGGKTLWQHHSLAAAAAKLAGRPVRMVLSREGVYRLVGGRTLTEQRVAIGAQADGGFDAIVHAGFAAKTPDNAMPEPFIVATTSAYAAKTFGLDVKTVDLDMLSNTFMRAPGEAVGTFALESAVDELAAALGMDPIDLRIRNEPKVDPTKGTPFSSRNVVEAYRAGAEGFGWSARNSQPGSRREGEWLIGMGCATATYPYYRMPGGVARLTMTSEGHATVEVAAHEMGMGTATTHTIIAAERLGLPMDKVTFTYGDSTLPGLFLAGGSQQTASLGAAVIAAQRALVEELLKLAGNDSPLAGLSPDQIACRDGGLCDLDAPDRFESYASILTRAKRDEVTGPGRGVEARGDRDVVDALVRRDVLRGAGQHGDRRDPDQPFLGLVRLRPDHQRQDRRQPVSGRHRHGPRSRPDRGDPVRRANRPGDEPQSRRVSRARSPRRTAYRRDVDRHPRSPHADGRAWRRRDRHHRRRRGRGQRDLQRHRQTSARFAADPGQGAGRGLTS